MIRNGNSISVFEYGLEQNNFNQVYEWSMPELPNNAQYMFYDHKGANIYFTYPNPQMGYENLNVYNIKELKVYSIENSHTGRVTGCAHLNDDIMLTTSTAGELKAWRR